ncbi:hypothetical protein [Aquabacterium sp.]|uniref:hypothetical protein n=1 Tax=Aquabacterium sp. TaxID=1872578 RepID=UPI003D6C7AE8
MSRRHRPRPRPLAGFTYLVLLWWMAISSIMLAALAQQWSVESRRQREMELVFRGEQIKTALKSYLDNSPGDAKALPARLEDLLEDTRGPAVKHHLRRWWPDPITAEPWGLVREGEQIRGVYSRATQSPLGAPDGVKRYEDWRFEVDAVAVVPLGP